MSRTKVLVVDDEEEIAHAISTRLRFAGYDVFTAGDGEDAINMALEESPDLVILDIGLPDHDGHQVAQRLLTMAETISTPVIFLNARTAMEDRAKAYRGGAIAYLTKPFQSFDLLNAVEHAELVALQLHCADGTNEREYAKDID